ncbi:unnamed protein product [Ambrosiozyma monospora]|uniref:Unnamed protein product n=1 Tax=Ambrosiozyma monospora TaxID=43982 RepID=A0ACB5U4D7_AMBMO|nr:unnamed protein product [Ambrosiozyma monospora]
MDSVDEILDGGRFVIDIGSGSDDDDEDDSMDEGSGNEDDTNNSSDDEAGYTDFDSSDMELELVPEGESAFGGDDDDEADDDEAISEDIDLLDDDSDNDSEILQDWLIENEAFERRRRSSYNDGGRSFRRGRFLNASNMSSDDDNFELIGGSSLTFDEDRPGLSQMNIPVPIAGSDGAIALSIFSHLLPRRENGGAPMHLSDFTRLLHSAYPSPQKVPNIYLRSTAQRWTETAQLFYGKAVNTEACRILPTVINNIYSKSLKIAEEQRKKEQEKLEKLKAAREEEAAKRRKEAEEAAAARRESAAARQNDHDPVYVTIGGRPVDISGTDIDPEFLQALPEDMREDVFAQHVRERRAAANTTGETTPEF